MKVQGLLEFSRKGFELLDRKRNVLANEMMGLLDRAKDIQSRAFHSFEKAYDALRVVNISMGVYNVEEIAKGIPAEDEFELVIYSVMGVEIPSVKYDKTDMEACYGFFRTNPALDIAVASFREVKYLVYELAEVENAVYRLAAEIKKTRKRANALEKTLIPRYRQQLKVIRDALEEKEREEFYRSKAIKQKKGSRRAKQQTFTIT